MKAYMRRISQKATIEIKHYKDKHNNSYVSLEATNSLGRVKYSKTYGFDSKNRVWFYVCDGKCVEVTQKQVYEALVNAYKSLTSIEDLVSENLAVVEEGY